jgi:hypothetical protein
VLAKWVRASSRTKVWLLGVQPHSIRSGETLTPTVSATRDLLRILLLELNHVGADAPVRPAQRSSAVCVPEESAITV